MTTTSTETTTWELAGEGFEFCNCNPGCTCNFSGFPTSSDGSCKAFVADRIHTGRCGDIDLSGLDVAAILDWPGPIHDGNGKAVFIVPAAVSDEQLGCLARIFTGALGGMPWEILGSTFEVAGVVRAEIEFDGEGINSGITIPGVGQARGTTLKNPVTGEDNRVAIVPQDGFIWKHGDCGQGSYTVEAEGIRQDFTNSNWIHYEFSWSNSA